MAERGGFEPPVRFPVRRFSKPVLSAAQPPLRLRLHSACQTGGFPRNPHGCNTIAIMVLLNKDGKIYQLCVTSSDLLRKKRRNIEKGGKCRSS